MRDEESRPRSVLVVDDEPAVRRALVRIIQGFGYEALEAADGAEALELLDSRSPDAMVLDVRMPRLNGHALVRQLKRQGREIPIIAISGAGTVEDVISLFRQQVTDFLLKPIRADQLGQALERALEEAEVAAPPVDPPAVTTPRSRFRRAPASPAEQASAPAAKARPRSSESTRPDEPTTEPRVIRSPIQRLIKSVQDGTVELPALSPAAADINRLAQRPGCGVDDVLKAIGSDPAIVADILRLANTTAYRGTRAVSNLRAACLRLGNQQVLCIARQVLIRRQFKLADPPWSEMATAIWRNAAVTAHLVGALAMEAGLGTERVAELSTAAVMHNIGELILLQVTAEGAAESPDQAPDPAAVRTDIARHHEEVGALVLKSWGMPTQCVRLARRHHRPPLKPEVDEDRVARELMQAAWSLAVRAGYRSFEGQEADDVSLLLAGHGIRADQTAALLSDLAGWVEETERGPDHRASG